MMSQVSKSRIQRGNPPSQPSPFPRGKEKGTKKLRAFSGVQPSGTLHIGNYLGAIKQFVTLQDKYDAFFCVVDLHAITVPQDPDQLRANTLEVAATYLAAGIDPKKSTIFIQSHVPAHTELGWILNTMTPLGELERMTQFKEKARGKARQRVDHAYSSLTDEDKKNFDHRGSIETAQVYEKHAIYAGLLNYPTLMAADILLYQTDLVPIGEDQLQHIELTRSLAERFNNRFGSVFKIPKPIVREETARIMGLDDPAKKMSKSAASEDNYVALTDSPEQIRRKIKTAVTDSGKEIMYDPKKKPGISNLLVIFSEFAGKPIQEIEHAYKNKTYALFKEDLAQLLVEKLTPLREGIIAWRDNSEKLVSILEEGGVRARHAAQHTLMNVKKRMGFVV